MRPSVLGLALGALLVHATAHAGRTEVIVGGGIVAPRPSDYRNVAEQLGYDRRAARLAYELEGGVLYSLNDRFSVGPVARFHYGELDAPYDELPSIGTYGVSLAARGEAELFPRPRIFLWAEPSYGRGWIGIPDARIANSFWGVRGGVGLGTSRDTAGLRFRLGYAYAPTTDLLSQWTGSFDWGGWVFQIDGVLRVAT